VKNVGMLLVCSENSLFFDLTIDPNVINRTFQEYIIRRLRKIRGVFMAFH